MCQLAKRGFVGTLGRAFGELHALHSAPDKTRRHATLLCVRTFLFSPTELHFQAGRAGWFVSSEACTSTLACTAGHGFIYRMKAF